MFKIEEFLLPNSMRIHFKNVEITPTLIKYLEKIDGVEGVYHPDRYKIDIFYGKLYSFEEIKFTVEGQLLLSGFDKFDSHEN